LSKKEERVGLLMLRCPFRRYVITVIESHYSDFSLLDTGLGLSEDEQSHSQHKPNSKVQISYLSNRTLGTTDVTVMIAFLLRWIMTALPLLFVFHGSEYSGVIAFLPSPTHASYVPMAGT
jgi:hypothetical protein